MNKEYCEKYDSFYDKEKDIWLEKKCKNQNCKYCKDRPEKPSQIQKKKNDK